MSGVSIRHHVFWATALLAASAAAAQGLGGIWGSPLYRVELSVSGSSVTGTFTPTEGAQDSPGTIKGEMKPDGKSLTAQWSYTSRGETVGFSTWLQLTANGRLLSGYRWTEEAPPSSFALHRAVNGQVPALPDETTAGDKLPPGAKPPTTPLPSPPTPPVTPGTGQASVEVIVCELVLEGQPQNINTEFTSPKTVLALVRYNNLPENSSLSWAWTVDGKPEASLTKVRSGSGWHYHGLQSSTALVPGTYQVTVSLNGSPVAQRRVTVRGASKPATVPPPTPPQPIPTPPSPVPTAAPPALSIDATICESVVNGQPRNRATTFTRPRSVVCLLTYKNLPAQSQLKWVWTRAGKEVGRHMTYVSGSGWVWHGLSNPKGLTPGIYDVALYARGKFGTRIKVTVK